MLFHLSRDLKNDQAISSGEMVAEQSCEMKMVKIEPYRSRNAEGIVSHL
jgi:hypothetical protein